MPSLMAILGLDGSGFHRELGKAEGAASATGSRIQASLAGFAGGALATKGVDALKELVHQIEEVGNDAREIDMGADRMGVTIERYQDLKHAAEETGTSIDAIYMAYRKLATSAISAENGDLGLIASFHNLGIEAENLKNMSPDQMFQAIQDHAKGAEMTTARVAAIMQTMGKSADQLIPGLKRGEFGEINIFARTDEQVKRGSQFKRDLDLVKDATKYLRDDAMSGAPVGGGFTIGSIVSLPAMLLRWRAGKKLSGEAGESSPADLKAMAAAEDEISKKQLEDEKREKKKAEEEEKARIKRVHELRRRLFEEQQKTELDKLTDTSDKIAELQKRKGDIREIASQAGEEGQVQAAIDIENINQEILRLRNGKEKIPLEQMHRNNLQQIGAFGTVEDAGNKHYQVAKDSLNKLDSIHKEVAKLNKEMTRHNGAF